MRAESRPPRRAVIDKWAGSAVAILGGGPSLTRDQVEACRGRVRVIAINRAAEIAPWADALYFCDKQFFDWHKEMILNFEGEIFSLENDQLGIPGLRSYWNAGTRGFSADPTALCTGSNSGYQVLNLLAHLGARLGILLGFDMRAVGARLHWHSGHPVSAEPTVYRDSMLPCFPDLIEPLSDRGLEILNSTPGSALDVFPKVPLQEALCRPLQ